MNWKGLIVLSLAVCIAGCGKNGNSGAKGEGLSADEEWHKGIAAAMEREDHAAALELIRPIADRGEADGQFFMGFMHYSGFGVAKDKAEAARWYRMAAKQGHAKAQANLGLMYHLGDGIDRNLEESIYLLRSAAEQRDSGAQFMLGLIYSRGEGVPKDPVQAYFWLNLAAEEGAPNAESFRNKLAGALSEEDIARAEEMARNWKAK